MSDLARSKEMKRNCNTCKRGLFERCNGLKTNKEYQNILSKSEERPFSKRLIKAHKFKENFICNEYNCIYIEYPIEVSKINYDIERNCNPESEIGKFVNIRPCDKEFNKTYLGLYLGELPIGISVQYNQETKELDLGFNKNPAIFVFELNKIVYGMESWWNVIENEEDLKQISDCDISNVWYVKVLRQINEQTRTMLGSK